MIEPRNRVRESGRQRHAGGSAGVKHIFKTVLAERPDDMAFSRSASRKGVITKLQGIVDSEFVRMEYTEGHPHPGAVKQSSSFR